MQNYRRHLEEHLLPEFEDRTIASIQRADVEAWDKKERTLYAASSVETWRGTLHLLLKTRWTKGSGTTTRQRSAADEASAPAAHETGAQRR